MNRKVICLVGPDGSGKSTQARLLINKLNGCGIGCEYKWVRFRHLFSLPLLAIARVLRLSEMIYLESGRRIGYHYFYKSRSISFLYSSLLYLDTFLLVISRVRIPHRFSNRIIICDRFVYDVIVDLMISTRDSNFLESQRGRAYLELIPDYCAVMIMIADAKILRSRRDDVLNDQTLDEKVRLYEMIGKRFCLPMIDASNSIEITHEEILTIVRQILHLKPD